LFCSIRHKVKKVHSAPLSSNPNRLSPAATRQGPRPGGARQLPKS
jgi:hypothetical protein